MTNYAIPDITFEDQNNNITFESLENIICIQKAELGCEVLFLSKPPRKIAHHIDQVDHMLQNKGMVNLNNRLLFRMRDVSKVLKEDFAYHICFRSDKRIKISEEEKHMLISRMIKI